jgi:hypothetical protein
MAMNRIVWTRLDTAIIVAISIMMLSMAGLAVRATEKSGPQVLGVSGVSSVLALSSDWICHPNHARGQLACINTANGRHTIIASSLK